MFSRSDFSQHIKYILFALEENAFLGQSKPMVGPRKEFSPCWSRSSPGSRHRHHRKEEDAHLHIGDTQEQSLSDYAQQDLSVMTLKITI
jgi:hypothetical protein